MKLQITAEVIKVEDLKQQDIKRLSADMQKTLTDMLAAEKPTKSILFVDSFPPRLVDNKAVTKYFPMFVSLTFQEAVALLRDCDNLVMSGKGVSVYWDTKGGSFLDQKGAVWNPSPADILSNDKGWYVSSKDQPNQTETEFTSIG